jgi:CBS-domain-containing membrane protein
MTRQVATVREDAAVSEAVATMLRGGQKVVAVTDAAGRLAGIVDRADLLHGLVPSSG